MKKCRFCGTEISDTAKKCKYCGEWVDDNVKERVQAGSSQQKPAKKINKKTSTTVFKTGIIAGLLAITTVSFLGYKSYVDYQNKIKEEKIRQEREEFRRRYSINYVLENKALSEKDYDYGDYYLTRRAGEDNLSTRALKIYKFSEEEVGYNCVVEFDESGVPLYTFNVETDTDIGNDGSRFVYEIGRIYLNSKNPDASKCTYNYQAKFSSLPVQYFKCSEQEFIQSLPEIAKLKKEAAKPFLLLSEEEKLLDICSMGDNSERLPECKKIPESHYDEKYDLQLLMSTQLANLRNTTLPPKADKTDKEGK